MHFLYTRSQRHPSLSRGFAASQALVRFFVLHRIKTTCSTACAGPRLSLFQSIILIAKLAEIRDWTEVFDDPILREHAFHSYERLCQLYFDLMVVREMKTTVGERCVDNFRTSYHIVDRLLLFIS
jgi:hypothetical protein